ncbi:MAG TPA: glycogen-binding domain-containing protein [Gemmatimonadaceae bacterium]|jgi:hypothetical protein|nr:glycogen-binding domain-containing protein [Gemmatimonadaceae bacterium]
MPAPKLKAAVIALGLVQLVPQREAAAQLVSRIEAGAIVTSAPGTVPANAFSLTPDLRYEGGPLRIAARGSAWLDGQAWQVADGYLTAALSSPTRYHLRAEAIGDLSRAFYDRETRNDQIDAQARVHLVFSQRGGMWLSSGIARPWRVAVVSSVDMAGAGAWTQVGGATLTGTYTNFSFTRIASAHDSAGNAESCTARNLSGVAAQVAGNDCLRQSRFSDVQGTVHFEKGFFEVSAQTGYRFGADYDVTPDSRRWASATATVWLSQVVAAVVGGGRQPANPARGLPARNYANFGLMFSPWPAMTSGNVPVDLRASAMHDFDVDQAGASLQRVQVQISGVQSVELMGDFTGWETVAMARRGRDLWEALLPIAPGVHQINVRVDGGKWQPPPGTPAMHDGFNGDVGILVIH